MDLKSALTKFVGVFKRSPESHGIIDIRSVSTVIAEPFPLGPALTEYYSTLELGNCPHVGGKFHLMLFSLAELEEAQNGWRWITDRAGQITEDTNAWKSEWVVIADRNGDAIFVDARTGEMFGSIQKTNIFIADSLASFFSVFADVLEIEMDKYQFDVADDDFNLFDTFVSDVEAVVLASLGKNGGSGFIRFFLG